MFATFHFRIRIRLARWTDINLVYSGNSNNNNDNNNNNNNNDDNNNNNNKSLFNVGYIITYTEKLT